MANDDLAKLLEAQLKYEKRATYLVGEIWHKRFHRLARRCLVKRIRAWWRGEP